jgi:hypothetical protein
MHVNKNDHTYNAKCHMHAYVFLCIYKLLISIDAITYEAITRKLEP